MLRIRLIVVTVPAELWIGAQDPAASLTAEQIVGRLVRADEDRAAALGGYSGMRRYLFENKKANKRAEMVIRLWRSGWNGH